MSPQEKKMKKRQVKVLVISASPVFSGDVEKEKEEELLLDSILGLGLDYGELYVEMPDPVQRTVTEISRYLKHRKPDVLVVVAHAYENSGGKTVFGFCEADGSLDEVTPKKLAAAVEESGHVPGVVMLWNHPEKHRESMLSEAAKQVHNAGVPRVIGFKKSLSTDAAREFSGAFIRAVCEKQTVTGAFEAGKRAIGQGETKRLENDRNHRPIDEHLSPVLYRQGKPFNISENAGPAIKTALPDTHPLTGSAYRSYGFVGRSSELRAIFKHIDDGQTAVVIHGDGGTGKSAVLTRTVSLLKPGKFIPILFRGEVSAEIVLEQIADAASKKGVKDAETIFESPVPYKDKLDKLFEPFIFKYKLLLIFEDFGVNQDAQGNFRNDRLKELITYFKDELKRGGQEKDESGKNDKNDKNDKKPLMLFASRYPIPKFPSVRLEPLPQLPFRQLIAQFPALRRLGGKDLKYLYFEIGGYPRAVQWLDALARHHFGSKPFKWEELRQTVPDLTHRIMHKESETADFSYLLVQPLLELLNDSQRRILDVFSLFRGDVPARALAPFGIDVSPKDRALFHELGLASYINKEKIYQVPRVAARAIYDRIGDNARKKYHLDAAGFFRQTGKDKTEKTITVDTEQGKQTAAIRPHDRNDIEARYHLLEAGEVLEALRLTAGMDTYYTAVGFPQLAFDLVKDIEPHADALQDPERLSVHQRLGFFYAVFSKFDDALAQQKTALEITERLGNPETVAMTHQQIAMIYEAQAKYPESLPHFEHVLQFYREKNNIPLVAKQLDKIGMLLKMGGDYEKAHEKYLEAEKINRESGDKKELAQSLEQLGRIHDEQGKFDEGLDYYRQSLAIREEIDDQPGVAVIVHQMGNVNFFRGDLDTAFPLYQRALKINKETNNPKSAGYSQGQIGLIWQRRSDIEKALENFRQSLAFFEEAKEEKGIAASNHQIGRILESQNKPDEALNHYQKALETRERTGDLLGAAITYGQLGMLYYQKEEYQQAMKYSTQAYAIFTRYNSPNADLARNNMLRLKQKLPKETFEAVLAEFNIKTEGKT